MPSLTAAVCSDPELLAREIQEDVWADEAEIANAIAHGHRVREAPLHAEIARLHAVIANEQEARFHVEAALRGKDEAMGVLFQRLRDADVDCSDLIP